MPTIPRPSSYQRLKSRIVKPQAPPVQTGKPSAYSGKTKRLARPIREARVGAKMVSRAVRTSFQKTLGVKVPRVSPVLKAAGRGLRRATMRLRQAVAPGLGQTTTRVGTAHTPLKQDTKNRIREARSRKKMSNFDRKNLVLLHREASKLRKR